MQAKAVEAQKAEQAARRARKAKQAAKEAAVAEEVPLTYACDFRTKGCKQKGSFEEMTAHESVCPYNPVVEVVEEVPLESAAIGRLIGRTNAERERWVAAQGHAAAAAAAAARGFPGALNHHQHQSQNQQLAQQLAMVRSRNSALSAELAMHEQADASAAVRPIAELVSAL